MNSARRPVLVLYQQLLRECHKFSLYNYREYFLRRTRDEFRENRNVKDPSKVNALLQRGRENLEVIRRQVIIGNLYMPEQRSIIDQQQSTHATSG